ncbi:MAG: site-specific integrase, partial [Phycisphaerae bacterium]
MRRLSRSFTTRGEAEAYAREKAVDFDRFPSARKADRRITLGHFKDEFLTLRTGPRGHRMKIASIREAGHVLTRLVGFMGSDAPLAAISAADLKRFFASVSPWYTNRDRPLSEASINKMKRTLRAIFSTAVTDQHLREHPMKAVRLSAGVRGTIRYITAVEFAALLTACDTFPADRRLWWRAFLHCAYTAGLRFHEIVHLTWADVNFENDAIRVSAKPDCADTIEWSPKNDRTRTIPVPNQTVTLLADMQATAAPGQGYVFIPPERLRAIKAAQRAGTWREGQAVLNNVRRAFGSLVGQASKYARSLSDREGKPSICLHDFRRTCITNWTRGTTIQTVQKLAGHANAQTTLNYYASVTDDQLESARTAASKAVEQAVSAQSDAKV